MEILFIPIAFIFGFTARQLGLPPLVGFLTAGFALNFMGANPTENLNLLSEIGILLLLFSIGLKVQVKKLFQPQIWGTTSLHMIIMVVLLGGMIHGLSFTGLSFFSGLTAPAALIIAFSLSFSSTVFAVKILEERGAMTSKHGSLAIGILVMQDLFAVVFITLSGGTLPSPLALGLLGLFFLKKPLINMLDKCGHGELLVLVACILPITGAHLFEYVGLKPDLGALVTGMLLAGYNRTDELLKAMFGFKDLFLVGFFLTIGMAELPTLEMVGTGLLLVGFVPVKIILFYVLLTRFSLRARTSLLASMNLANFSEFGLIVGAVGVKQGWISSEWLVIIAVALSLSMIAASLAAHVTPRIYSQWNIFLRRFETKKRLPGDNVVDIGLANVAVFGMGRVGTGVYDNLQQKYGRKVIGFDFDEERVKQHINAGRKVVMGDVDDYDSWKGGISGSGKTELVFLTMSHAANLAAAEQISSFPIDLVLAAIVQYDDEIPMLKATGVDHVFNFYEEAGTGFSNHICSLVSQNGISKTSA